MAYLIAWISFDGRQIEDLEWEQLLGRTRERAPLSDASECREHRGENFRAFAIKSRSGEPDPLWVQEDGRIVLADSVLPLDLLEIGRALDEPCAQIVIDGLERSVVLSRDRLGQKPLVWTRVSGGLLAASKESILLGHPGVSRVHDDGYLCAHIAGINAEPGHTLYRQIATVDPGATVRIDAKRAQAEVLSFEPDFTAYKMRDETAAVRFQDLLRDSVQRCCIGATRLGLTLSAGLDSSSVAALLPSSHHSTSTVAVNYGTAYRGSIDERELARELSDFFGFQLQVMDTADHLPAFGSRGLAVDPGHPYVNPYLSLNTAVYRELQNAGVDVFLTGHFADFWNPGPNCWLRDAISNRRWLLIAQTYGQILQSSGAAGVWRDRGWRHLAMRAIGRRPRHQIPAWMNERWAEWIRQRRAEEDRRFKDWPHPQRAAYNFGSTAALDGAYEGHFRDQFGIQSRHPYRDWGLLRFVLSLPAYQSYRPGNDKWIGRKAVAGLLPKKWSERPKQGGLLPLLEAAVELRGLPYFEQLVEQGRPIWEPFLSAKYVKQELFGRCEEVSRDWLFWQIAMLGLWSNHMGKL